MPTKYIVVLGSLMSGLGKGVVTSSILKILDFYNIKALPIKFDGYLNYDCGTMNPYRHGEVFVLDDKSEVDMDFGLYERFLNKNLTGILSITGGKLFGSVIRKERVGKYLGEDVQIIPHLTNEAIAFIERVANEEKPDVVVIEVGGTVGDIENSYFIEAVRQFSLRNDTVFINLTYSPKMEAVGEQKTKPAQLGFRLLLQAGIRPSFVICRSNDELPGNVKEKLALFANLEKERVIDDSDDATIYNMPLHFMEQGLDRLLIKDLGLSDARLDKRRLGAWKEMVRRIVHPSAKVKIAVVGKYTGLRDSYASVKEALVHAAASLDTGMEIRWIESTELEKGDLSKLQDVDGILVPGGFGNRGIEGMINAIQYARENGKPYLGLCLGMQLMVVEYARNVALLKDANSSEFSKRSRHKVIDLIYWQRGVKQKGGTMRLGAWECRLSGKDTIAYRAYGKPIISERHRHRYEFNNKYRSLLSKKGLVISGTTKDNKLVEFVEWGSGFGIGTQAHPELKSRLEAPAPLFVSFVKAASRAGIRNYSGNKRPD